MSWDGDVCRVMLHEPARLNPLGEHVRAGLEEVVARLRDDLTTRVVVLSGAGRAFSAGADLRAGPAPPADWVARRRASGGWQRLLDSIESLPQVTVASLHGRTVGGAVLLAAACDLRIGADDLLVSVPEVALGIPLTWAGLPRLVREIGLPRTRELVMTGRVVGAEEALAWGFVTRLVAAAELRAATDALVAELLEMPDVPLRMTHEALVAIGRDRAGMAAAWADADLLSWSGREPDTRAAMRAYAERHLARRDRDD